MLGEVIAAASGVPYRDFVRSNILEPLGMASTGFTRTKAMSGRSATAYQRRASLLTPLLPRMLPPGILGGRTDGFVSFNRFYLDGSSYGGLVGSVADAARFAQMHLLDGEVDGVRILTKESARAMREIVTPGKRFDLGLGWFRPRRARTTHPSYVEHLGAGAGFFNDMRLYPALELGVVVMGNATKYDHESVIRAVMEGAPSTDPA